MFYIAMLLLGLALTAGALLKGSAYVAGITAFATTTFAFVQPAYHFFTWATPWLIVTVCALVWAIRSRSTWSRVALIVSAGVLTLLTLGASKWTFLFTIIAVVFAFIEGERGTKPWKLLAPTSVAVATLAMAWSGNLVAPNIFGTAAAADGDPHSLTIQPGDLLPDEAKCDTSNTTFNRNSMAGTKGRLWADSVSTPFVSKDKDAQFKELTSEICVNPTLGDAYVQALSDAHIGEFSVAEANPWLGDFTTKSKSKDGLKVWLVKSSDGKTIHVTADYQSNAQMVNALLFALDNQGTKTAPSTANWPLRALVADTLPRVHKEGDPKKQETLPFMALTYTQKSGGCPYVLGVNEKDKRPENVSCETAVKVAPKKPTPPRLTVTPPGKGGSTPTPSTTPTKPGHSPSPSTTPSKPPKSCPPGQSGNPCLEIKDPKPIPSNSNHTPAASHSESAKPPVHPSQTAKPSKPGGGSTQPAEGSTPRPKPSESVPAPEVSTDPSKPAQGCTNPVTGEAC